MDDWTPAVPASILSGTGIRAAARLAPRRAGVASGAIDASAADASAQSVARTENEKILATNASSEAPLERQKMIILFMKIRLLSLQSRAICN